MSDCEHPTQQLTRRVIAGGAVQVVSQCLTCGKAAGNPLSHTKVEAFTLPAWDAALQGLYKAAREAEFRAQRQERSGDWWAEYREHMASPAWQMKRDKALTRDGRLCQGCLEAPATEVHHTTYVRLGRELMLDLVSLCRRCHETIHEGDE